MQYLFPQYYKKFKCNGSACPSTCCAGWKIQIDPASLKKYRKMPGAFGSRLRNEIDWENGCFRQYGGKCTLLNEEGLCDLYLEGGGEGALCRACHIFPRHVEEFQGVREYSLSLSCPEAAELILSGQAPAKLLKTRCPGTPEKYPEFDSDLFRTLRAARRLMFRLLQNRQKPWRLRAAVVLALAHDLQQRLDRHAEAAAGELFRRYSSPGVWDWFAVRLERERPGRRAGMPNSLMEILKELKPLRESWEPYLQNAQNSLQQEPAPEEKKELEMLFTDTMAEQLMVYFLYVYFCGAVYDRKAYGKVKFAAASTVIIRELLRAGWRQSLGRLPEHAAAVTACRYARETEHLDENLNRMESMLEDENRFSLKQFMGIL